MWLKNRVYCTHFTTAVSKEKTWNLVFNDGSNELSISSVLFNDPQDVSLDEEFDEFSLGDPLFASGQRIGNYITDVALIIKDDSKGEVAYSLVVFDGESPNALIYKHRIPSGKRLFKWALIDIRQRLREGLKKYQLPEDVQSRLKQMIQR